MVERVEDKSLVTVPAHMLKDEVDATAMNVSERVDEVIQPLLNSINPLINTIKNPFKHPLQTLRHPIEYIKNPLSVIANTAQAGKNLVLKWIPKALSVFYHDWIEKPFQRIANKIEKIPKIWPRITKITDMVTDAVWKVIDMPDKLQEAIIWKHIDTMVDKLKVA